MYVNVSVLADSLGPLVSSAIPAFRAFTGCDYTAAFARKGKLRPFVLLETNKHFQNVFSTLGKSESVEHEINKDIESVRVYGKKNMTSVNEARLDAFL